jgi:hypothetical protein
MPTEFDTVMKMSKVEQSVSAKRAPVVAFTSGIDMGDSLSGAVFNAQLLSARVRATFEKARIIEAGADLPSWKDVKPLLALAKADGRIKFDRDDIERGMIRRLDREYSNNGMPRACEWVRAHLALGLPNAEAFHEMSLPARKSLANSATRKEAVATLSKLIGDRLSNAWRNALKHDARKTEPRGSNEAKTVQEAIASATVAKLTDRIKKAQDNGAEIPVDVIRAARTLVAWIEGKKAPKPPKPDTTATEVQA